MDDLIEAYLSVYEDSDIKSRAKAAVDHQRHGDHGDDDALQKATKAVKKATRYPGRQGPKVMPSMAEAVDSEGRAYRNPSDRKPSTSSSGSRPVVTTPYKNTAAKGQELKRTNPEEAAAKRKRLAANILSQSNEEVDLYDVVLDYLLDEGFADNEKNAITIMANMSEEWIDDILDEAQIMSVSGPGGLKHMINRNVLKLQNAAAKEAQERKSRKNAETEAKNAQRAAQARKSSIERLNAKPGADSGDYDSGYHGDDDTSDGKRHYSLSHTNRSDRKRRAKG